ncbi:MAG: hypothetical protein IJ803_02525 [Oribacterium sp.]|nr:hypothetical protein [Oribacterium sp.]
MVKIRDKNLPSLAGIYNAGGKNALYNELRNKYGIKYPWSTLSRMKTIESLGYDESKDCFVSVSNRNAEESLFMSIDELCTPMKPQHIRIDATEQNVPRAEAMEKLVKDLIGDRLLELSRYVIMDPMSKTMIIDKSALTDAGYTLVTH